MNTNDVIILARKYMYEGEMQSSAQLCLSDAVELQNKGELNHAKQRALKSLAYTIGVFHPDYRKASK